MYGFLSLKTANLCSMQLRVGNFSLTIMPSAPKQIIPIFLSYFLLKSRTFFYKDLNTD